MTLEDNNVASVTLKNATIVRNGRTIWSEGTLSIPQGSITAIVGTNGAGKTTLLHVELGLLSLTNGEITMLGEKPRTHNQQIGYVPQHYASDINTNISAEYSVLLGLTGTHFGFHRVTAAEKQAVREALAAVNLLDYAHYRLGELSGGMRQRVAIAQALVSKPKMLLLDEPLANLDISSQRSIIDVLTHLNQEHHLTIQVVSHDINMLLPILTGAIYLLDGHPHYSPIDSVMDSTLLTHLYGTKVEVITTPQGDMFVRPDTHQHDAHQHAMDTHSTIEAAHFHAHDHSNHEKA